MTLPIWLKFILVLGVSLQVANICTTVYLHRALSHNALTLKKPAEWTIRLLLWLTTTIQRKQWVAVHRKHHAFTDKEGDPHSPYLNGFWKIQLWNFFYYVKETKNIQTLERYAKDIRADFLDKFGERIWVPILLLLAIFIYFLGPIWGTVGVAAHFFLYIFLSSTINGAGHWFGYKRHNNTATNLWIVALFTAGEGLHNNHHAHPSSAKLCDRWWEVDFGWITTWILIKLKMAKLSRTS